MKTTRLESTQNAAADNLRATTQHHFWTTLDLFFENLHTRLLDFITSTFPFLQLNFLFSADNNMYDPMVQNSFLVLNVLRCCMYNMTV